MKTSKTTSLIPNFESKLQKGKTGEPIIDLVHPRIQVRRTNSFGSKKASSSLMVQMYSQENEVLFI
jgi:hypothetical protein